MTTCPFCGWPDADVFQVISRHRTPAGETVWTRCACGSLQARVLEAGGMRITARGRPAGTALPCGSPGNPAS